MCNLFASNYFVYSRKPSLIKVARRVNLGPGIGTLQCRSVVDAAYQTVKASVFVRVSAGVLLQRRRILVTLIGDNEADTATAAWVPPGLFKNVTIPWFALSDNFTAPETDPALALFGFQLLRDTNEAINATAWYCLIRIRDIGLSRPNNTTGGS